MTTAREYLGLFYEYLSKPEDPRFVQPEQQALALQAGVAFRPKCLPDDLQNQAQAHYAAYLLSARYTSKISGGGQGSLRPPFIKSEQEGDVIVQYDTGAALSKVNYGPITPYDAYSLLARRCTRGAILTRFS